MKKLFGFIFKALRWIIKNSGGHSFDWRNGSK